MTASKRATTPNNKTTTEETSSPPPHAEKVRASPGSQKKQSSKDNSSQFKEIRIHGGTLKDIEKIAKEFNVAPCQVVSMMTYSVKGKDTYSYQVELTKIEKFALLMISTINKETPEEYLQKLITRDIRESLSNNLNDAKKEAKA